MLVDWQCRLNGMSAQKNAVKKVIVTHFRYIFHIKTV